MWERVNSLQNDTILDWLEMKGFADNKIKVTKKTEIWFGKGGKPCWKGANSGYQHFAPFPTMFSKGFSLRVIKSQDPGTGLNDKQWQKEDYFDQLLTLSQTTNFRLFQTERVCRRQFQIWRKWQKPLQTGRKHCGKWRNCSLRAISPFPTVFSKDLCCRHVKTRACLRKG